ncbi:site-specific DNA-methyltransferase [Polyangium sp. 6x1]|uniref:site-specific DNA-methyltransferase n=1 Tax=Polyangium sp. 6x1 TaxID=3042689 RepID=UPI0024823C48|nr:site-specific DNA-methyltransferase [Polyangium sp. 6x1]MDI1442407.1 site-specific DNA-methyltransferase [Polyangium sp. 6x1]
MAGRKKSGGKAAGDSETPIEALEHKDARKNIPTREMSELVSDEEDTPETMLYPRDPTLDPQLVWKGKDEQDRKPLAVPVVPIYIQEKIMPKALIEDLRARASGNRPQLDLFGSAFGAQREFEEQIEFYKHDDKWTNRMILGDSLVVMTSLAQKEGLKGKVQMVYMDPPYGIKFGSNWQVSTRKREVKDGKAEDLVRQPEQIKAFRDTWELGIHSYLGYLRDRLAAARDLLNDSGSIFVQIGDENVHLVRCLLDEIFGSENFCSLISYKTTSSQTSALLTCTSDYILWYAKEKSQVKFHQLYAEKSIGNELGAEYGQIINIDGDRRALTAEELEDPSKIPSGWSLFRPSPLTSQGFRTNTTVPFRYQGRDFHPGSNANWKTTLEGLDRLAKAGRLLPRKESLSYIRYMSDFEIAAIGNTWEDTKWGFDAREKVYVVQTNVKVITRCMQMTTDPGDLVLDPTCGSGTTAFVAEQWARRWITIDTSRVAVALARARLLSARYPNYLLADSHEGVRKEAEIRGAAPLGGDVRGDIRAGFVYKRVPHIMLGSIAHDEEIDPVHARFEEKLEPLREKLNKLLKQKWQEWEIPREAAPSWSAEAKACHAEWWQLRRARQKEIDASIARRAESEILYDQPYEDPKRIRVSGPFTVESLSPHRMLDASLKLSRHESPGESVTSFVNTILDNLKKAGVQNTVKNERLVFERLNPFPGAWIQAEAEYKHKSGAIRRAAISIGPEHGTVGPEQVKKAAEEARKGKFDLVVVCGFAFDAHAFEAAKEISPNGSEPPPGKPGGPTPGAITVLLSRMNPDLAMGDALLKKTGAGNLFMVFGEPDIRLEKSKDGKYVAEIRGLDVYDPTTGEIRSHTTDDIACWFIDTDYSGDSFFVRHAYFTGANDPYEKLKRALKAEIDEETWSSLYTTKSRPFDPPKSGLIAIKVINHYGDEVLKVYKAP